MDDTISRAAAIDALDEIESEVADGEGFQYEKWRSHIAELPSAQPYTDEEIQKMQDLEQAQLDKAYQIGVEEGLPSAQPEIVRCKDCKHNQLPATSANASCEIIYGMTNQDGFCSMAEPREVSE